MFKSYDQKQQFLLPLNLDEFVPKNHISRVLNDLIEHVDIGSIESTYSDNGCPAYNPRLLLKILLYGYLLKPLRPEGRRFSFFTVVPVFFF